jgi:hypothetical protein
MSEVLLFFQIILSFKRVKIRVNPRWLLKYSSNDAKASGLTLNFSV